MTWRVGAAKSSSCSSPKPTRELCQASEKVRLAIATFAIPVEGTPILVTASFGVAAHGPDHSLDSTIAAADRALYRAREEGRDRVLVLETSD